MLSAINGRPDSEARGPVGGGASLEYQHDAEPAEHAESDGDRGLRGALTFESVAGYPSVAQRAPTVTGSFEVF